MLRSIFLALCATIFTACATASPPLQADVLIPETNPRWVSGKIIVNFTMINEIKLEPAVMLCINHQCDTEAVPYANIVLNGTKTFQYFIPQLRYNEIWIEQKKWLDGSPHWIVYSVSRNFRNRGCRRWFLAIPDQEEGGHIRPEGNRFTIQEEAEREEGCDTDP